MDDSCLDERRGRTDARADTQCRLPLHYFGQMIDHCYDCAEAAKAQGRPIVGIMCEYTPRNASWD